MDKNSGSPAEESITATTMTIPPRLIEPTLEASMASSAPLPDPTVPDWAIPSWQDLLSMVAETPPGLDGQHSLPFLDRFTSNTGLVQSFDCGTEEQRRQVWLKLQREGPYEPLQAMSSLLPLPELPFDVLAAPPVENANSTRGDGLSLGWLNDPLSLKTHQILLLIRDIVRVKPRNSAVTLDWSPGLQQSCLQFFSPSNIRKFLGLYWAIWHPNVNFVHRPSFDIESAKPAVLATMAVIGACVSPAKTDNDDCRLWFNCVEEMVFTDDDFNSDMLNLSSVPSSMRRDRVQALQAAYMVCLYQNWEGSDASKRRIRRYRFATLVSTARDIDLTTVRHTKYSEQARYEFDWRDFAMREELIRVLMWIFLLDTAFVIFNNLPPRMVIREMRMHLAVPDNCFHSPSTDQCLEQLRLSLPSGSQYWKMSFGNIFKSLCSESLAMHIRNDLASLGPLNLFALTSAIHSQVFQYRNSWGTVQLLLPIQNALRNWRDVWQLSTTFPKDALHTVDSDSLPSERMWERYGLCKHCPEYWLLANLMVTHLTNLCAPPIDNQTEVGQNELEGSDNGPVDAILSKYDQTSMRQVNDLILSFQNCQIR
ncbi:hypothetical protein PHISP_00140 [Aspergillus sp. HF37]|nr:hypothetical protein PHISP_00140 [Aspergillus sp. HF37]